MARNKGRRREEVIANLLSYPRLKMDLLAVGRETEAGSFPNEETGFMIRKWVMTHNHRGELFEIAIPRHCSAKLADAIHDELVKIPRDRAA